MKVAKGSGSMVYHDPCELGRGCGVYEEPRNVLRTIGELKKAEKERDESICCGGSLGSLTLDNKDRGKIAESSINNLTAENPQSIVTACPLCYRSFREKSPIPVKDFAEVVCENIKSN